MIWLAWRQHRLSLLAGLAAIVALAVYLILTGLGTRADFERLGLDQCSIPAHLQCADASAQFVRSHATYRFLAPLFLLLPAIVGVFWGAPLVSREIEQGTHRLVWTQSISRGRWLAVKAGFLAVMVVIAAGSVTWLVNWWLTPIMRAEPQQFEPGIFDLLGVVPVAYALAALAIGIASGTFTRKLVPAIGLTLVLFLALRVGVSVGARPNFMAPVHGSFPFPTLEARPATEPLIPAGWKITLQTLDSRGRFVGDGVGIEPGGAASECPRPQQPATGVSEEPAERTRVSGDGLSAMQECAKKLGFHVVAVYQPEDRYWRFQLTEAALYLVLSGALLGASAWWIRHRIS